MPKSKFDYVIARINRAREDMTHSEEFGMWSSCHTSYVALGLNSRQIEATSFVNVSSVEGRDDWREIMLQIATEGGPLDFMIPAPIASFSNSMRYGRIIDGFLKDAIFDSVSPNRTILDLTGYEERRGEKDQLLYSVLREIADKTGLDAQDFERWTKAEHERRDLKPINPLTTARCYGSLVVGYAVRNNRHNLLRLVRKVASAHPKTIQVGEIEDLVFDLGMEGDFFDLAKRRCDSFYGGKPVSVYTKDFVSQVLVPYVYAKERALTDSTQPKLSL